VNIHSYADDTLLHLHGRQDDTTSIVHRLESCITDVGQWMYANRLMLNTDKTELLSPSEVVKVKRPPRPANASDFAMDCTIV